MLENIIFSVNITLPLFGVMAVGYLLRKTNVIETVFINGANTYLYYVGLPAKLFLDVASSNLREVTSPAYALVCAAVICCGFFTAWGFARAVLRNASQIGTFVHGAFRGNFVYIGLSLAESILGPSVYAAGAQVLISLIPLYNICAVLVLTVCGDQKGHVTVGKLLIKFFSNPMLLSVLAALPFALFQISIIPSVRTTLSYLGGMSTALALLVIGASIQISDFTKRRYEILMACLYKLLLQPLLFLPVFIFVLTCTPAEIVVAFVMLGAPSAANVYVMTKKLGGDARLGSGILVASELLSVFSMTFWILVLKSGGVI